jgi:hypothetical protein
MSTHRWNIEETKDGFRICRGVHERAHDCEWEYFVPESAARADLVRFEWLVERLADTEIGNVDPKVFFSSEGNWAQAWRQAIDAARASE